MLAHEVQHERPLLVLEAGAQEVVPVERVVLWVLHDRLERVLWPAQTASSACAMGRAVHACM